LNGLGRSRAAFPNVSPYSHAEGSGPIAFRCAAVPAETFERPVESDAPPTVTALALVACQRRLEWVAGEDACPEGPAV
jgi:hypothetical protein